MKRHETFPLLPIASASGVWLYDTDGNRYFDAISSWWTTLFGHGHPPIAEAIADQAQRLDHVLLAGCTHEPAIRLAERLSQLTPRSIERPDGLSRCLFSSDGSSSVEAAIKLAVHYWQNVGKPHKKRLIKLQGAYHGETTGAMSVMDLSLYRRAYESLLQDSETICVPNQRLAVYPERYQQEIEECLQAFKTLLEAHADDFAALIVEPLIQCANQMTFYDPLFLKGVAELCRDYDILLIADEIAVGMGRTGKFFASEHAYVVPDIICLSKGLSGGTLPLSVTLTTETIFQAFYDHDIQRAFLHSHSYTGNPIACRAALATLDCMEQNDQLRLNSIHAEQITTLLQPLSAMENIVHSRHLGMIWAFDVLSDTPDIGSRIAEEGLKRGLLLRPLNQTVYLMPPYGMEDSEITFMTSQLIDTVCAVLT